MPPPASQRMSALLPSGDSMRVNMWRLLWPYLYKVLSLGTGSCIALAVYEGDLLQKSNIIFSVLILEQVDPLAPVHKVCEDFSDTQQIMVETSENFCTWLRCRKHHPPGSPNAVGCHIWCTSAHFHILWSGSEGVYSPCSQMWVHTSLL